MNRVINVNVIENLTSKTLKSCTHYYFRTKLNPLEWTPDDGNPIKTSPAVISLKDVEVGETNMLVKICNFRELICKIESP